MFEKLLSEPTVAYCEPAAAGFIARPGYFISNIPYILLGIYILTRRPQTRLNTLFGVSLIAVGSFSAIYDATFTFGAQIFDLIAMTNLVILFFDLNLRRIFNLRTRQLLAIHISLLGFYTLLVTMLEGSSGRIFFGVIIAMIVATELLLYFRKKSPKFHLWLIAFVLFIVGFGIWLLDANQILCDPTNLFNGRGVYHYMTAGSVWCIWKYYRRI